MFKKISILLSLCLIFVFAISNLSVITIFASADKDDYTAKALYLMDYNSGQVLFENNSTQKIPVASIVKLMTINLTCKELQKGNIKLEDKVTASKKAASMGGSQVFIEEGGEYSIEDLLKSTIVSSANDASVLLAETIAGSEENFVTLMNKEARLLGLENTNYVNCTGLPASNQFSCAKDCAILLKEVTKYNDYHKFSTIWMDKLKHSNNRETELVNTNKLIRYFEGCDGGKTGSTSEAGYCLAATAKRGNMRLIGVVLGAQNGKLRFAEASKLLNYGFSNYENELIVGKNFLENDLIAIQNGRTNFINVEPQEELFVLTKKGQSSDDISTQIVLNDVVSAPIKKGDSVGEIIVIKNGEVIEKTNLISLDDVAKATYIDKIQSLINNWKVA